MWNNLNCADCEEKLSDYIEGTLAKDVHDAVEQHIHSCAFCEELVAGMMQVITVGRDFPVHVPPAWLATRIIANTPQPRPSFRGRLSSLWQSLGEPRTALAIFTAAIVLGWLGGGPV